MSLMPVMCGKRRGCTWCAASILTTWLTDVGDVLQCDGVASGHPDDGHDDYDDAGSTVPIRNPLLVMPDMAEVPRSVTSVATPVHGDREKPHEKPVLRQAGHSDHVAMDAAANPSTVGYHTTFWIHCRKMAVNPRCLLNASLTQV